MRIAGTSDRQTRISGLRQTTQRQGIAAVIGLLLLAIGQASASEGYLSLYYNVEGFGESSYWLYHSEGAFEGLDDQDRTWQFTTCVTCMTDTKAVAFVDGEDLKLDYRPLDSEAGVTVYCSVVSRTGEPIVANNAVQWVTLFMDGFEGYDIAVNGHDARTTSRIDLSPVTGDFASGETIETLSISFTRRPGYEPPEPPLPPNPDPDPQPDPNTGAMPPLNRPAQDILFITNSIEGWPQNQTGVWQLLHARDALNTMDINDVPYARPLGTDVSSLIASPISDPRTGERCLLAVDARPPDSPNDIDLNIGVESASGEPVRFGSPTPNKLIFAFPAGARNCFAGKPMTFQQYDPVNPDQTYPVWDIRKIIAKNQGVLPLADLMEYRGSGVPYLCARVSTSRKPGDVLRDGRIDANDYRQIVAQQGFTGPGEADIASPNDLGLPDGIVDAWDLHYLYELLDAAEKDKVTPPVLPVLIEGFETGKLDALNWYSMQWPRWFVTSEDRHTGVYSVRAGPIVDDEATSLSLTVTCAAGRISFWRRVSCEPNWDNYRFSIDNELRETLSGEVAWSEVSFPIEAGKHTFRWEYEKDDTSSSGDDTVYLDDLCIPVAR